MRLHVLGLPHTETTSKFLTCAYTQKIVKFGKMMVEAGHEVFLYAAGDSTETVCTEYVSLLSTEERLGFYGSVADDPNGTWAHVTWNPSDAPWKLMNERAIPAIRERIEGRDLLLCISGIPQKPVVEALSSLIACEPFVGYEGISLPFCAFESYAWKHYLYGKWGINDGRWYDVVIPNYFDPDEFGFVPKKDYLLYMGRLIFRKGIMTANQLAKAAGMPLVVAGPGVATYTNGTLVSTDNCVLEDVDYRGSVGVEERARLMGEAAVLLAPTSYIEPFGGVAVEAMFSGTPVLATDWGAFTETVEEGVTGYRFHTLADGVTKIQDAMELNRLTVRERAMDRFSLNVVAGQFTSWLERLDGLRGVGWNALPTRTEVQV